MSAQIDSDDPDSSRTPTLTPALPLPPSKTRMKQAAHDLQALGSRLVELPRDRLRQIDLPELLADALIEARSITRHEARRRQMQYIGKLMREIDPAPIQAQLAIWDGTSNAEIARQHALERWRTRLMDDEGAFTEYAGLHPGCDVQQLRTLVRNARREAAQNKPPRSYRELFRVLRSIETESPDDAG